MKAWIMWVSISFVIAATTACGLVSQVKNKARGTDSAQTSPANSETPKDPAYYGPVTTLYNMAGRAFQGQVMIKTDPRCRGAKCAPLPLAFEKTCVAAGRKFVEIDCCSRGACDGPFDPMAAVEGKSPESCADVYFLVEAAQIDSDWSVGPGKCNKDADCVYAEQSISCTYNSCAERCGWPVSKDIAAKQSSIRDSRFYKEAVHRLQQVGAACSLTAVAECPFHPSDPLKCWPEPGTCERQTQ